MIFATQKVSMLVGYAPISTDDQGLTLQRTALKGAGCERIHEEKVSGSKRRGSELARMLDDLRRGMCWNRSNLLAALSVKALPCRRRHQFRRVTARRAVRLWSREH